MGHDGTHRRTGVGVDLLPARAQILRYALPNQISGTPATGEAGKSVSERGKPFCAGNIGLTALAIRLVAVDAPRAKSRAEGGSEIQADLRTELRILRTRPRGAIAAAG